MATLKYFAQKSEDGYPIPSTMMGFKETPAADLVEIPAEDSVAAPGQTVKKPASGLRYFVRRDAKGNIIPNSLITSIKKPKGLVYEFKVIEGTATPEPTGIAVKVTGDQMFNPVCNLTETNLNVQITSGTSMSDALTITGDFASLGAYFTPVDPNNIMAQPPRFRVAYDVNGITKHREFKLTAVGVASGDDSMFGTTQESICPTYWVVDQYFDCSGPAGVDVSIQVTNGTPLVVNKYYKFGQGSVRIKSQSSTPLMMASTLTPGTAYNTCAESLA